jgi:hypothetical protein
MALFFQTVQNARYWHISRFLALILRRDAARVGPEVGVELPVVRAGHVVINGEQVTDRANGIEGLSMNTGPSPAGVLENHKGLITLGPKP